jgi:hypothetical protein
MFVKLFNSNFHFFVVPKKKNAEFAFADVVFSGHLVLCIPGAFG